MTKSESIRKNTDAAIALIKALSAESNSYIAVIYTDDNGVETKTYTASDPWQLGHGQWIIKIEGRSGGIDCARVRPMPDNWPSQPSMTTFPWDKDVPHFTPTWDEIKDKAHLYRTARVRETGLFVAIELVSPDRFRCSGAQSGLTFFIGYKSTKELCAFVL